ncbi:MAG: response regulator transcription factor [Chitinophagaceae bacterium]
MNQVKIRVIIVDDHQMVRETWKMILQREENISIVAECASGGEAIEKAASLIPDVILMDINMSPINGFEATQQIVATNPSIKIIGISINNQPSYVRHMMQMGAKGYVTKNSSKQEMMDAIIEVNNGGTFLCDEIKIKMFENND